MLSARRMGRKLELAQKGFAWGLNAVAGTYTTLFTGCMAIHKSRPESVFPKSSPNTLQEIAGAVVEYLATWGWAWMPMAGILPVLAGRLLKSLDQSSFDKLASKQIQRFHDAVKPPDGHNTNFRVTLYRYAPCRWFHRVFRRSYYRGFTGFLYCYKRSNSYGRPATVRWRVSLEAPKLNEGMAGRIFGEQTTHILEDLTPPTDMGKKKTLKNYIEATCGTEEWIKKRLDNRRQADIPRAFWGSPIEVEGKPWGVLLVDSTLAKIGDDALFRSQASLTFQVLAEILPKGGIE